MGNLKLCSFKTPSAALCAQDLSGKGSAQKIIIIIIDKKTFEHETNTNKKITERDNLSDR